MAVEFQVGLEIGIGIGIGIGIEDSCSWEESKVNGVEAGADCITMAGMWERRRRRGINQFRSQSG